MIRNRSVSRSKIIKISIDDGDKEYLDPIALLGELIPHITDFDIPLHVRISDLNSTVVYLLSTFVSKEYEVVNDTVKFGFKRIRIKEMKVNLSYDLEITAE